MALPAAGDITAAPLVPDLQGALEDTRDAVADIPGGTSVQALTLSGSTVTPAQGSGGTLTIDTGGPATGTLSTIAQTNTFDGQIVHVYAANASRVITVDNGAGGVGQILTTDGDDFVLDALDKWILLRRSGTDWVEIDRSYGVDLGGLHAYLEIPPVWAHTNLCAHRVLSLEYATASTVTVTASAVVLSDSTYRNKHFVGLSETLNVANTGANGRDVVHNAGVEAASTWYHVWAIGKEDGTLDVFASPDCYPGGTSIYTRLPAGYDYAGYLGACYNDASKNLVQFSQLGDLVSSWDSSTALSAGTSATYLAVSLSTKVPQTAREVFLDVSVAASVATTSITGVVASEGSGSTASGMFIIAQAGGASSASLAGRSAGSLMLSTTQQVMYRAAANSSVTINATGWRY